MTLQEQQVFGMNNLPPKAADLLAARGRKFSVGRGEIVFQPDKICNDFNWILKGCLRVQMVSQGGREIVLYRVNPGDTCIISTSCLLSGEAYNAEAIVEEDVSGIAISRSVFMELLAISSEFRETVFASFGNRVKELLVYIEEISFGRLDQRLISYLCDKAESKEANNTEISITHEVLARELATHREVVSRLLKDIERKGWISLGHGKISLLNLPELNEASQQL